MTSIEGDNYSRPFSIYSCKQIKFYLWVIFLLVCMSGFYFILDFYFKVYSPKGVDYYDPSPKKLILKIIILAILTPICSFTYKRMKYDICQIFLHTFFVLMGSILMVMSMQTGKAHYYMLGYAFIKSSYVLFTMMLIKWLIPYTNYWRYLSISK